MNELAKRPDVGVHFGLGTVTDDLEHGIDESLLCAHPRTPTRTLAKRAGDALCPVCATWTG